MAADKLVEVALRRKTDDNVTVVVARLFGARPEQAMARSMRRVHSIGRAYTERPHSFVQLCTPPTFVQVIGGFD
jgi:serine/threonine protein phosphatase PrpC